MKKFVLLTLVLAMVLSMAACGCDHVAGDPQLISVDTAELTMERSTSCTLCEKELEKTTSPVGIAPENSVLHISPADWFACLSTNIRNYETSGALMPAPAEAQDDALLYTVLTMSGFRSVMTFYDKDDNVLTTAQSAEVGTAHRIRLEAQFDNSTSSQFYTLLLLILMTNNSDWDKDHINNLGNQIMGGEVVTDNGYTYNLQIISALEHTVALNIVAD